MKITYTDREVLLPEILFTVHLFYSTTHIGRGKNNTEFKRTLIFFGYFGCEREGLLLGIVKLWFESELRNPTTF